MKAKKYNPEHLYTQTDWAKKEKLQKQLVNYRVKTGKIETDKVKVIKINGGVLIFDDSESK